MNVAQIAVVIVSVVSENQDNLMACSGIAEFQWPTGKEGSAKGTMYFSVNGFMPLVGESYIFSGEARIARISIDESKSYNDILRMIVKRVSRPLDVVTTTPITIIPTPKTPVTTIKQSSSGKNFLQQSVESIKDEDLDSIPF